MNLEEPEHDVDQVKQWGATEKNILCGLKCIALVHK